MKHILNYTDALYTRLIYLECKYSYSDKTDKSYNKFITFYKTVRYRLHKGYIQPTDLQDSLNHSITLVISFGYFIERYRNLVIENKIHLKKEFPEILEIQDTVKKLIHLIITSANEQLVYMENQLCNNKNSSKLYKNSTDFQKCVTEINRVSQQLKIIIAKTKYDVKEINALLKRFTIAESFIKKG